MYKKIFFQFILLIILFFILWYIFYFYLREDSKIVELSNNSIENSQIYLNSNEENEKENYESHREITENLVYKSKDAKGNTYLLESKFGKTDIKNKNIILLDQVTAKINLMDKSEISIKADHAEYDYDNLNTKFFDNVKLEWIKAHTNQTDELSIGNEGADKLANMSIGEEECPYNNSINQIFIIIAIPYFFPTFLKIGSFF